MTIGITHAVDRAALARAVLEGVAFAFADGQDALLADGADIRSVSVVSGGARSPYWGRILASVLRRPLAYHPSGETGPAFGAARLARLAATDESPADVCTAPPVAHLVEPDPRLVDSYAATLPRFRRLYRALKDEFRR